MRTILVLFAAALIGCGTLTVAPKPVNPQVVAFSGNQQNAGIIDCDTNGCIVDRNWLDHYRKLEAHYKVTLPADDEIKPDGKNYRVPYSVMNSFLSMRASERGP